MAPEAILLVLWLGERDYYWQRSYLGTEMDILYSKDLIARLNCRGIIYLAQAINTWNGIIPVWKRAEEIGLTSEAVGKWDSLIVALCSMQK